MENYDVTHLESTSLDKIEADSFWLMSKLLDGIQDNYTFAQPGIQLKVNLLKDLVQRIDGIVIWAYLNLFLPFHFLLHKRS